MIKNTAILEQFEKDLVRREKADFHKNLKIVNELHREARALGVFGKNLMDGIEVDLRIARIINHVRKPS